MALNLPTAVTAYFRAANAGDAKDVALCFTHDAQVRDEGRDFRGRAAIEAWSEETYRNYSPLTTPLEVTGEGSQSHVLAQVAGNFPGSPLPLRFHFTLENAEIAALSISA